VQSSDILPGTRVFTRDAKELGEVLGVDMHFIDVSPGDGERVWRLPVVLADRMDGDRLLLTATSEEISAAA
jgi:hypothetical protein